MRKVPQVILAVLLLLVFGQAYYAQARLELLGEANVDGEVDHDKIKVGRADGKFRAIQIKVERAPVDFQKVVIHYGNGADEAIEVRSKINAGGESRLIDLRGRDRVIESVEFWYAKARYDSAKPKVLLYGLP